MSSGGGSPRIKESCELRDQSFRVTVFNMSKSVSASAVNQFKRPADDHPEAPSAKKMMASASDQPDRSELHNTHREQPMSDAKLDSRCKSEIGRLLGERTFLLTKSGSKFVSTGVDPLAYNEPILQVRNRLLSSYISFTLWEFEELLTSLPSIMESIEDVPYEDDEGEYKTIAELKNYNVLLLPFKVAKFRHNLLPFSSFNNACMSIETLKVLDRMGDHFLVQLYELKRCNTLFPRMDYFAAELATKVVRDNGGSVNEECSFYVIKNICNDNYNAHDLYTKFYHHIIREVGRIVHHMNTYNNYNV